VHKSSARKLSVDTRWETELLYHDGRSFFDALIEALREAQSSIFLESYIFENDELGKTVVDELVHAAERGLEVRVLVDAIGSPGWSGAFGERLKKAGGQYKIFHRLPWDALWRSDALGGRAKGIINTLRTLNRRNHRKLVLLDGNRAFAGSMNISSAHLGKNAWRDTGVQVSGDAIPILETAMERAWAPMRERFRREFRPAWKAISGLARLNSSGRMRRRNFRDLKRRIRAAQQSIWITTPYFVPARDVLAGLIAASHRGVEVKILLPARSDVFFMTWVGAAFHHELMRAGVSVYQYLPSVLHAKILIIDDWATVGSSNFNHRSLLHDLEVDIVITHDDNRRELREHFKTDIENARKLSDTGWSARSAFKRFVGRMLLLFRYWL